MTPTRKVAINFLMAVALTGCCKSEPECPRCNMPPEHGLCQAAFERYYYNKQKGHCETFAWGGCGEVPFTTLEECQEACGQKKKGLPK